MKQIYDFEQRNPPVLTETFLREKIRMRTVLGTVILICFVLFIALTLLSSAVSNDMNRSGFGEITYDLYFENQHNETVWHWVNGVENDSNTAYILRYKEDSTASPGKTDFYYLIYIPSLGTPGHSALNSSSDLFTGHTIDLTLEECGRGEDTLFSVSATASKEPALTIHCEGKALPCEVTDVEFNPTWR